MKVIREMDVFTFDELSEGSQIVAMDHMREFLYEVLDHETITEELNGELVHICNGRDVGAISSKTLKEKYGVEILWSMNYVQSDFLSVRGRFTKEHLPLFFEGMPFTEFYTTMDSRGWTQIATTGWDSDEGSYILCDEELSIVTNKLEKLERQLFRTADSLIESYTSEESALEQLRHGFNTRRFVANGKCAPTLFWSDDF